jgi:hypothetical protein
VGQPRDGNPLCSRKTQDKILKAGLPKPLADRLAIGR